MNRIAPYNPDVDWFLNQSEAAQGIRSAFDAFISTLERGGGGGGDPNRDPYTDAMISATGRARELLHVWRAIPRWGKALMLAQYTLRVGTIIRKPNLAALIAGRGQLSPVELFLAWRINRVGAYQDCISRGQGSRLYRFTKAAHTISVAAHDSWHGQYRAHSPHARRLRERLVG